MDSPEHNQPKTAWKILLLGALLVGFSVWTVANLVAVQRMRGAIEVRVGWLAGLQQIQATLHAQMTSSAQVVPPPEVVQAFRAQLDDQLDRMSSHPDDELAGMALQAQARLAAPATEHELSAGLETLTGLIGALRSSNRDLSVQLGKSWTFINVLAFAALLLAAATLGSMWLNHRRAVELARARRAHRSSQRQLGEARNLLEKVQAEKSDAALSAEKLKEQFLSTLSHELRTPMHGIMGMTELALLTELNEEQSEYLTAARESARSLLQVIDSILDYAVLASGRAWLVDQEFDLHACLSDAFEPFCAAAEAKDLKPSLKLDAHLPRKASGDAARLQRLLTELLDNAVKFTEHGEITLEARFESEQQQLELVVRDTGQGIEPELQREIFEAFRQGDGSMRARHGGLGLGLALSAQIAELMNGKIALRSDPGQGTEVCARLRIETQPALSSS